MADEAYDAAHAGDSASDKRSHSASDKTSGGRVPWRGTTKGDDELTMVRLPAGLVREFDEWYKGQAPDAQQRRAKDPYVAIVFRQGLDVVRAKLPPVQSLDDKLADLGLAVS